MTAAAAAAAEKRAKAEAEEGPRLANVGAAPIAAKEEVSERKPSILEEAIESAVREQLAAERERLAAEREQLAAERKEMKEEHAKQEKLWLNRSAQLEAALAKPEKDLG